MAKRRAQTADEVSEKLLAGDRRAAARAISWVENQTAQSKELMKRVYAHAGKAMVVGITGAGGSGKSTLIDHLIRKFRDQGKRVGVVAVDPSSPFSGGALLGDRIRFQNHALDDGVYIRSMGSRGYLGGLARTTSDVVRVMEAMGNDVVIVETLGAGQDEVDIIHVAQTCLLLLTPGMGDDIQAMKAGIMEIADLIVMNKADLDGAMSCLRTLEGMIAFGFRGGEDEWQPRVIPTVSSAPKPEEIQGIDELVGAVLEHQAYLHESRAIEEAHFKRVEQELGLVFKDELEKIIFKGLKGTGKKREYVHAILEGKNDPYSVVDEVLRQFIKDLAPYTTADRRRLMPYTAKDAAAVPSPAPPDELSPHRNLSGFAIQPVYGPEDVAQTDYEADLGQPGEYPFTRGVHETMYRGRMWTIRQLGSLGAPEEANQRIRQLIGMGATGVSICFDMPTIMGRDSDDPLCEGEVGTCCGVAVDSIQDMRELLSGIALDEISINFVSNSQSAIILAMFCAVAEERGMAWEKLSGTMQNDVLKEYQAQKSYYFPPRPSMGLTVDTISFCSERLPRFNPISISGYHLASAGATPAQELAFTLANGFTYVEETIRAGLAVDAFAPRLSFFFKTHNDLFENVAKYRAARRIWARTMREKYGAQDPRSWRLRVHTQTSGSSLTAQQMENNVIRTTLQALAAVLSGTQSLHTNSFDEALSVPTPRSEKLALRTQQIIAHESGAASTADPLAGSYYLEALTNEMEAAAGRYFETIEKLGAIAAVEQGFFQREIAESAFRYQRSLETRERIVVGLNEYVEDDEPEMELRENDSEFEGRKIAGLAEFKTNRDHGLVQRRSEELRAICASPDNVMPTLIEAVKAGVTLGEAVGVMREVFGEYREPTVF